MAGADDFVLPLRAALLDMHTKNSREPIRFPPPNGAFPEDFLLQPPPVVPDANRLRDDILYACRHDRRTVLVTAANAGLLRLFCTQHVVDEVVEHSVEWAKGSGVSHALLLRRWLLEYLPAIRVIPSDRIWWYDDRGCEARLGILDRLGKQGRLAWSRARVDSASVRAKHGDHVGANLFDPGKPGSKIRMLCDKPPRKKQTKATKVA